MPAEIKLPVYVRVGEQDEAHFGEVTISVPEGEATVSAVRRELAAFLRAAADEMENPSQDEEEVDDAAS